MSSGKKALCWFNGPSARQFWDIDPFPIEIGCNFIEQRRSVQHVCAFDQQCVDLIQAQQHVHYWTRPRCVNGHFRAPETTEPYHDSGTLALRVAHGLADHVYVLGCDWGESDGSVFDDQYTWRAHQPGKQSNAKLKIIHTMAKQEHKTLTFVHERPKAYFGAEVKWIGPKRFLELVQDWTL